MLFLIITGFVVFVRAWPSKMPRARILSTAHCPTRWPPASRVLCLMQTVNFFTLAALHYHRQGKEEELAAQYAISSHRYTALLHSHLVF